MVIAMALERPGFDLRIERRQAFFFEAAVHGDHGLFQPLSVFQHAVAENAVHELQEQGPFTEPCSQRAECLALPRRLILRQAPRQQRQRFTRLHGIHRLAHDLTRQNITAPRRNQPGCVMAALQERTQILLAPSIIDDEQNAPLA